MSTKIASAEVFVCSPGRNFVTLKITTEDGVYGLGDGTLNGRELAVVAYLEHHIIPTLIGRDAHDIEDIWQYLYRGSYWRRGHVNMTAIGAVDMALWDIKAKVAKLPLYQLLGGRCRDGVTVYCHAYGNTTEDLIADIRKHVDEGFKAVRIQTSVPGLPVTYGVPRKDVKIYEPADSALPHEATWNTAKYMRHLPTVFKALREEFGDDLHLLHDVHHRLTPIEAAHLGKSLEPYNLFWMEDATPAENQEAFRLIRQHTTTPIALGEVFNSIHDSRRLMQEQLIDYIRTNLHAGGISHLRRVANLADLYQIRTGFHGSTDLSPVAMGCALHFDLSISNFGIQEYMEQSKETEQVFPHAWYYKEGKLHPGESVGHGVDYNIDLAKKHPYKPASLPVNRLEDGSMWNW